MATTFNRRVVSIALLGAAMAATGSANAQKRYDPGASDTEVKIGTSAPFSGPVSAYGTITKTAAAYFAKVNADGGVNGRKITYITYDDGFTPAKTVEMTRKLVEQDEVLAIFFTIGTSHNLAIQKYLNAKKVPQMFVGTGATNFGEIKTNPWTIGWQPSYNAEAMAFGQHIVRTKPNAKVAVLQANDDFGKDFMKGLMEGLGSKSKDVTTLTFENTDPTIDSQIISLKGTGAESFVIVGTPRFATMALKKAHEIGWAPNRYVSSVSQSVGSVMKPAGEGAKGAISATYLRDPTDPATPQTKEYSEYAAFMKQYYPAGDPTDSLNLIGYGVAQTFVQALKQAGDNLTRENLMKQALNLDIPLPMLYPGVTVKTSPTDAYPIEKLQLIQFNGTRYEPIGGLFGGK
jgi:branched-chain amino acid transport system substrate-binding protein